ncbi:hypothetical protein ACJX0J_010260, partial [Zea mays]
MEEMKQDENVIAPKGKPKWGMLQQNGGDHRTVNFGSADLKNGLEEYFGSNFGRFEVAVLNTSIVPTQIDVVDDGSIEDLEEDGLLDVGWEVADGPTTDLPSELYLDNYVVQKDNNNIQIQKNMGNDVEQMQPHSLKKGSFHIMAAQRMVKNLENSKGNTFKNSSRTSLKNQGMFWNSRGLRDLAKSTFLYDTSLEYDLDFVALLETNRKDFSNEVLTTFCGGRDFHWENSQS